jgi:hypothetical protein
MELTEISASKIFTMQMKKCSWIELLILHMVLLLPHLLELLFAAWMV